MKQYELLYIIPGQFDDNEVDGIIKEVATLVETEASAKITRNESLGKIKLAYIIKKVQHGTYVLVHFEAEPEKIEGIDRAFRLRDDILRHTIVDMPKGAADRTFEIKTYVAPLSEEARDKRKEKPRAKSKPALPAPTPAVKDGAEKLSVEDLDKKLDKILEADVTKEA